MRSEVHESRATNQERLQLKLRPRRSGATIDRTRKLDRVPTAVAPQEKYDPRRSEIIASLWTPPYSAEWQCGKHALFPMSALVRWLPDA
ncbi:hypothetical protein HPB50_012831 [Hyalomma asiaticum]|uniref:Uncharacterized protein n=1 Tax=Hyalomma asiaticum TaxID=266040 RepID=A0ACB7S9I7_HYAAI|nr:hypothetical protein HPB50_012831 [Hyalomma asiaticum]